MPYLLSFFQAHYYSKKKPPTLRRAWWLCLVYKEIFNILKHKHSILCIIWSHYRLIVKKDFLFVFVFLEAPCIGNFAQKTLNSLY